METGKNNLNNNVVYDDQVESGCLGVFLCILGALFAIMAIINLFMGFDDVSKLGDLGGYGRYGGSGGNLQTKLMFQQVILPFMQYITLSFLCFGIYAVLNAIANNKILRVNVKAQSPVEIAQAPIERVKPPVGRAQTPVERVDAPVENRQLMPDVYTGLAEKKSDNINPQTDSMGQNDFNKPEYDLQNNASDYANDIYKRGMAYYNGINCDVNYFKAVDCFHVAAQEGHSDAQYMLGVCLHKGEGVGRNYEMAVHYLLKAANNGNGKAKLYLNKIM